MKTEIEIRQELVERVHPHEVTGKIWSYLLEQGKVELVCSAKKEMSWLSSEFWAIYEVSGGRLKEPAIQAEGATAQSRRLRESILSELYAAFARRDPVLMRFRKEVLRNRILMLTEIRGWIDKVGKTDGPATRNLENVPLPGGVYVRAKGLASSLSRKILIHELSPGATTRADFLEFGVPEHNFVQRVPIARGGILDRLRVLSEHLSQEFGWQPAQATLFILSDSEPQVQTIRASFTSSSNPNLNRKIQMEIDPVITPAELGSIYRNLRKQFLRGKRTRALTEKHLRLVVFIEKAKGSAEEARSQWNKNHPKWQYRHQAIFNRDANQAKIRLLENQRSMGW